MAASVFVTVLRVCTIVFLFSTQHSIARATSPQNASQYAEALEQACTIYCWGDVLNTIQLSGIYNDSKTFVDMPMKVDPDVVMDAFNSITNKSDIASLTAFMDEYFYPVGSDLDPWVPTDLQDNPPFISTITDPEYAAWAYDINQLWGTLGKQVNTTVKENPQRHSFVPLNHPMIVPGGRFRESYYWDSWWILKGLLVSSMPHTAMNVLNILLDDVINFGFVPNGARIYYLDRSQPPVLSEMVMDMCTYFGWSSSNTSDLLVSAYSTLETEYNWWMNPSNNHIVSGLPSTQPNADPSFPATYTLNKYHSNGTTPRPESYMEDVATGNGSVYWRNVRTGAETGWDFSSRWIGAPHRNMSGIAATGIVPVDLNSILLKYEQNMAAMQQAMLDHGLATATGSGLDTTVTITSTGHTTSHSVAYYELAALNRSVAMNEVLWNETLHAWQDFNLTTGALNADDIVAISSFVPLWAGILTGESVAKRNAVLAAFEGSNLHQVGGILTTTFGSDQQWDAPNAWPPLVWFTIEGLVKLNLVESVSLAQTITAQWLDTMYMAYNSTGYMYEKYNAYEVGVGGGGGEYTPQKGFGWTNGVALYLLNVTYASKPFIPSNDWNDDWNDDAFGGMGEGGFIAFMVCIFLLLGVFYFGYSRYSQYYNSNSNQQLLLQRPHGGMQADGTATALPIVTSSSGLNGGTGYGQAYAVTTARVAGSDDGGGRAPGQSQFNPMVAASASGVSTAASTTTAGAGNGSGQPPPTPPEVYTPPTVVIAKQL